MKFLFKYPSRGRPNKFKEILKLHLDHLSNKHEYKFIFTFDIDDDTMNNENIISYIKDLNIDFELNYGNSKSKIEAINSDLENKEFDILVLLADDIIPILKDYDDLIYKIFNESQYGLDCVLHFNTSMWSNLLDIFCIMGKQYYDRFKYIYHPSYKSICADNEFTEVARLLNRSIFSEFSPFEHNFFSDELAIKNSTFNAEDDKVYWERKKINFNIK